VKITCADYSQNVINCSISHHIITGLFTHYLLSCPAQTDKQTKTKHGGGNCVSSWQIEIRDRWMQIKCNTNFSNVFMMAEQLVVPCSIKKTATKITTTVTGQFSTMVTTALFRFLKGLTLIVCVSLEQNSNFDRVTECNKLCDILHESKCQVHKWFQVFLQ